MSLDVYLTLNGEQVYWANITHNLGNMASRANIYMPLWRPDEIGVTAARQLITPLTEGLDLLRADPEHFKQFNAENGWGLYEHFVPFVEKYLEACEAYPDAVVRVSRCSTTSCSGSTATPRTWTWCTRPPSRSSAYLQL